MQPSALTDNDANNSDLSKQLNVIKACLNTYRPWPKALISYFANHITEFLQNMAWICCNAEALRNLTRKGSFAKYAMPLSQKLCQPDAEAGTEEVPDVGRTRKGGNRVHAVHAMAPVMQAGSSALDSTPEDTIGILQAVTLTM